MKFKFDEFVWAKLKGFSPWPGKIMFGHSSDPPSKKKEYKYVYFFGSHNHAWVSTDNIYKYAPYRKDFSKKLSTKVFRDAVRYIAGEYKGLLELKRDKDSGYPMSDSEDEDEEETPRKRIKNTKNKILKKKMFGNRSKDLTYFRGAYVLRSEVDLLKAATVKIVKMKPKVSVSGPLSTKSESSFTNTATFNSIQMAPGSSKIPSSLQLEGSPFSKLSPEITVIPLTKAKTNSLQPTLKLLERNSKMCDIPNKNIEKSMNLHCNLKGSSTSPNVEAKFLPSVSIIPIKSAQIKAVRIEKKCGKRFGFIGLGNVGQKIAKTFLSNGHTVNVWSRSPNKYGDLVKAGAYNKDTPAKVIVSSDIIFCCVSNADEFKQVVFSKVLKGFKEAYGSKKIYIDLTTIDSEIVGKMEKVIHSLGGLFFEAAVLGSITAVDCSSLIFLCAGNLAVFEKIRPCLEKVTRNIHYFGSEFGAAAERNLTFYAIQGIMYSALNRCIKYINKEGYDLRKLKSIIQAMPDEENHINMSLKNMNRHFIAALSLDNNINKPSPCGSVSHDTYKRASCVHFEDDVVHMEL